MEKCKREVTWWRDEGESEAEQFMHRGEMWNWKLSGGKEQVNVATLCNHGELLAKDSANIRVWVPSPTITGVCANVCGWYCL